MKYRWGSTVALGALGLAGVMGAQSPSVARVTRGFDLDPRLESEVWCAEPQVVDPVVGVVIQIINNTLLEEMVEEGTVAISHPPLTLPTLP
jgi:hypothetical protein